MWHLGNVPEYEEVVFLSSVPTVCLIENPAQQGERAEACGESVKSWETLVCLHSVSKRSRRISDERNFSLLSCLLLP